MSTADSQVFVSSSVLSDDLHKQLINPDAATAQVILVGRIGVVALSLCALYLAMDTGSSVLGLVSYAWASFSAAFGPVLILILY